MSIDLAVQQNISSTPQAIQDQNNNSSAVYVSTNGINLPQNGKLVLGLAGAGGDGEWIANSAGNAQTGYGIAFVSNNVQLMTLLNSGNFGIGTTTPTAKLHVVGPTIAFQGLKSGNGSDLVVDANGNVWTQNSSARFKENVRELKADFKRILDLSPVSFTYKENGTEGVGYMAEEVAEKGLSDLVTRDPEGKPLSVHYKALSVYLVELVKQQQALLDSLQSQVAELGALFGGARPQPAAG